MSLSAPAPAARGVDAAPAAASGSPAASCSHQACPAAGPASAATHAGAASAPLTPDVPDVLAEARRLCTCRRSVLALALVRLAEASACMEDVSLADITEELLAEIDELLSEQVSVLLHHPAFQALESAWRGLRFLADRIPPGHNIVLQILNISKDDLRADFEDAPEIIRSGLYFHVYVSQYGQFGGEPVGALIGNYSFDSSPADIRLLTSIAAVSAMAHAPFIAAVDKGFFGIESWEELPNLSDLHALFEMSRYASWRSFRTSPDARYVGLTLPRFLLRAPYGPEAQAVSSFRFTEDVEDPAFFCWGNTAFALASRLAESFARYHWCVNIVGQEDGAVSSLPTYCYESMDVIQKKIPTEVLISEQREFELSEEGFIALTLLKGARNCAFFSAFSCQAPLHDRDNSDSAYVLSYNISRQLPYLFLITRLAHYIKVLQREYIGSWKGAQELERELNQWLSQYVTAMAAPDLETRCKRPFCAAQIRVRETDHDIGWYTVELKVQPHFRYMGLSFTLALTGKLDKTH